MAEQSKPLEFRIGQVEQIRELDNPAPDGMYKFISTPSHGYLRVPLMECKGLDISGYSYQDRLYAYLEEDSDARIFFDHKGWETWESAPMIEQHSDSFDRRRQTMQRFEQF